MATINECVDKLIDLKAQINNYSSIGFTCVKGKDFIVYEIDYDGRIGNRLITTKTADELVIFMQGMLASINLLLENVES